MGGWDNVRMLHWIGISPANGNPNKFSGCEPEQLA